jgi:hypothetical protein
MMHCIAKLDMISWYETLYLAWKRDDVEGKGNDQSYHHKRKCQNLGNFDACVAIANTRLGVPRVENAPAKDKMDH